MEPHWYLTKDGDLSCLELYERHYSAYHYKDGRTRSQFVGPGETITLRTGDADAMFVWRKFIDDSGQDGVNCAGAGPTYTGISPMELAFFLVILVFGGSWLVSRIINSNRD